MKILISLLLILLFAGCSTSRNTHPVPIGFFPEFKGKGFVIDLLLHNQSLPPGSEAVLYPQLESKAQLMISNYLPEDVFMRIEESHTIKTISEEINNGRNNSLKFYGSSDNPPENEFLLIRGTNKTKYNYRGPDSYHRWLPLPSGFNHYKVEGNIKIIYYLTGDTEQYIIEKKFNFTVKKE